MPSPRLLHDANNRLPACIDVDMLDRDLLLAFAAMAVECFKKGCVSSRKLAGLGQTFIAPLRGLACKPGSTIAIHYGVVSGNQLRSYHAFQLVPGTDAHQSRDSRVKLPPFNFWISALRQRVDDLISEKCIPVVRQRPTHFLEKGLT